MHLKQSITVPTGNYILSLGVLLSYWADFPPLPSPYGPTPGMTLLR